MDVYSKQQHAIRFEQTGRFQLSNSAEAIFVECHYRSLTCNRTKRKNDGFGRKCDEKNNWRRAEGAIASVWPREWTHSSDSTVSACLSVAYDGPVALYVRALFSPFCGGVNLRTVLWYEVP
jgi:hypothetical protein